MTQEFIASLRAAQKRREEFEEEQKKALKAWDEKNLILSEMLVTINTLGGIVPYCRAILRATTNIVKFAIVVCGDGMKLKLCIADRQINALMKAADPALITKCSSL